MALRFKEKNKSEDLILLKQQAAEILFANNHEKSNTPLLMRAGLVLFIFLFCMITFWLMPIGSYYYILLAIVLGVLCVPLILMIGHESIHGNFTNNSKMNQWGSGIFYFLGTSPYFWKLRHLNAHHPYTNIRNWDLDIEQSKLIRLDAGQKWERFHRFQIVYMPFLFMMYTLNWFFFRDFRDINNDIFGNKQKVKHPKGKIFALFAAKLWHFFFLVVIPILLGQQAGLVIGGFFVFHFSASLATTLVLVSTHIGMPHELIRTENDDDLPYNWVEHQIRTSGDFSTSSKFVLHFFGGFNHHLSHHLFPNIPYFLYPKITPLVKQYCEANDLPYNHFPTLIDCIKSHFSRLHQFAKA